MSPAKQRLRHRSASSAILLVGGGAIAIALWVSASHRLAIVVGVLYLLLAVGAYLWSGGRGDVAAILRVQGDERQRGLDRDATAITGAAMSVVAIVGAIVEIAHNANPGAYGVMCVVGGVAYSVSLFVLRRRR